MMFFVFLIVAVTCAHRAGIPRQQIPGPSTPSARSEWLNQIMQMRADTLASIGYNGSIFDVNQLAWTQTAYLEPQLHPFDRFFYDFETHQYTVDFFLADL